MVEREKIEYKKLYTGLFCVNYLLQGFNHSMFSIIIPIYILSIVSETGQKLTISDIAFIASIITIPSAIKLFYGILSDKYGLKKLGRRRPWIFLPVLFAGIMWTMFPLIVPMGNIIIVFMLSGLIINIGIFMADTALDGLILDICPEEFLGRVQGFVWGFRSVGLISGGPILVFLYISNFFTNIESTFVVLGILLIISSFSILLVKEPLSISHINIIQNLKGMFKEKKDIKTYVFAFFNSFSEGVILLFASLFILIQLGIVQSQQMSLSLTAQENERAFIFQSYISLTVSAGIIIGSIAMGYMADLISRKFSVYFGMIFLALSIFLLLITNNVIGLFIIAFIIGIGVGFRHSAYSPIASQMAKSHPEFDSTYFSFCNSLSNLGSAMGLILTAIIFNIAGSFMIVFIIMAIAQLINLIPFSQIKSQFYEVK